MVSMRRDLGDGFRREVQLTTRGDGDSLELSFSSELPVSRGGFKEILSHEPADVDMSRMAGGDHPLLLNHDPNQQVGVVDSARIDPDRKGRAKIRFSNSQLGREIADDVKRGIRRLCSVGYRRLRELSSEVIDGIEHVRFAWQPYEISIVPIPADMSVGIGRSLERVQFMSDNIVNRENEIAAIRAGLRGKIPNVDMICDAALRTGQSLEDLRAELFRNMPGVTPVSRPTIELTGREQSRYSVARAIRSCMENAGTLQPSFEKDLSDEVARMAKRDPQGFYVPHSLLSRANNVVGTASLGGNVVATNLAAGSFIEILRPKSCVAAAGARMLEGLVGNCVIPRQYGAATAYWVAEETATTLSNTLFNQITLSPKCITGYEVYSRQLLVQSTPSIDALIRDDLLQVLSTGIDAAALHNQAGAPTSITGTSGIGSVAHGDNGGNPTWASVISLESAVAVGNADIGALSYMTNAAVRGYLKSQPKSTAAVGAGFVWERVGGRDMLNGYTAYCTNQIASNLTKGTNTTIASAIVFGNWNDLIIGTWGGSEVIVDPVSAAINRDVKIYVHNYVDFGVRHAASFSACLDALTT